MQSFGEDIYCLSKIRHWKEMSNTDLGLLMDNMTIDLDMFSLFMKNSEGLIDCHNRWGWLKKMARRDP